MNAKPLLIDHDDSFTFILGQYLGEVLGKICGEAGCGESDCGKGSLPKIVNHNAITLEEIQAYRPSHIILSPGPGTVKRKEDFAIGNEVLEAYAGQIPILGVCLGHQGIGAYYGAKIIHAPEVMHGKRSEIRHGTAGKSDVGKIDTGNNVADHSDAGIRSTDNRGTDIFKDIPSPLTVMRYHSLMIDPQSLINSPQSALEVTARTEDGTIMAIRHKNLPIFGVQFHPESIGTEHGKKLLENFLRL